MLFRSDCLPRIDVSPRLLENGTAFDRPVLRRGRSRHCLHAYHGAIHSRALLVTTFFLGANIIGAIGNWQLERIGRTNFLQKREIEQQNALLQERVREQRAELIQIEKAVASTSDAIGIFSTSGELTYKNQAFEDLLIPKDASRDGGVPFDDIVARALSFGSCEGEREAGGAPEQKKVLLIQADAVQDEEGRSIGVVVTCRDITERKDAEEKMRYLSFHDQLTGLFNRTWFDEELQRLDKVRQLPLSLIMADLNGLKLVNDTYGHAMGDSFLQACAGILKQACRGEDIILHDIGKIGRASCRERV